jgi:hypothetical protein
MGRLYAQISLHIEERLAERRALAPQEVAYREPIVGDRDASRIVTRLHH